MSVGSDIAKKVVGVYNSLAEVRVITIVADVTVEITEANKNLVTKVKFPPKPATSLVTVFKLDSGDTINSISPDLEGNTALREYHGLQVDKAVAVLPANLQMLVDLAEQVIKLATDHADDGAAAAPAGN